MKQILKSSCSNLPLEWKSPNMFVSSEAGRGINAHTFELDDVFPPDDLDSALYTQFVFIYIPLIIAAF